MALKKRAITHAQAVKAINEHGILLTYPIDNREKPDSLWSVHYPDKMRWEWDSGGDDRVARLWHLRTELSTSREVVYAKWYGNRATFFSREVFTALLAYLETPKLKRGILRPEAQAILEVLEVDSPQSTKQIKLATDLRGKPFESTYEKSMKQLWSKLWIVGFGEVEDGAFPSLAVGATPLLFEDLWEDAKSMSKEDAWEFLSNKLPADSLFFRQIKKSALDPVTAKRTGDRPASV